MNADSFFGKAAIITGGGCGVVATIAKKPAIDSGKMTAVFCNRLTAPLEHKITKGIKTTKTGLKTVIMDGPRNTGEMASVAYCLLPNKALHINGSPFVRNGGKTIG